MIAIVDYGAGNLTSVKKAFDFLEQDCTVTSDPAQVAKAAKIVLPGVGHFSATAKLKTSGLHHAIFTAINHGTPFLGICVGMQWMFETSEESPETAGLAILPGACERFPGTVKSPHVGWNRIDVSPSAYLFRGLTASPFFYFTHSYRAPMTDSTSACCEYGGKFSAAVERERVFGVQFHPEKSGAEGLKLLGNFCALPC
jgi:glutamine amidotransferase